jgi:hypothetical protein
MKKTMRIGTVETNGGRRGSIYIKVEFENGRLLISGVIGPMPSGNALGGCGQIDMEFEHKDPKDNDERYGDNLTKPEDINFAPHWDKEKWFSLLAIWKRWHLNDMRAGCEHQRALGWKYDDHHDPKTFRGEPCPTCGYEIGSAWLKEDVPEEVISFIESLPDTDKRPSWV